MTSMNLIRQPVHLTLKLKVTVTLPEHVSQDTIVVSH